MTIHKIPNQIIKKRLIPLQLNKVNGIALHHMDSATWGVKEVEAYHVNTNGWNAIGYNFWVGFDGTVYEGRGFNVGAHITGYNDTVIGIGFQGNYQSGTNVPLSVMPDAQFNAGVELIAYLREKVPSVVKVAGHSGFAATACPGNKFPLYEMVLGTKRGEAVQVANNEAKVFETVDQAIQVLVDKGIINSPEYWTSAVQVVNNLDKLFIKIANAIK